MKKILFVMIAILVVLFGVTVTCIVHDNFFSEDEISKLETFLDNHNSCVEDSDCVAFNAGYCDDSLCFALHTINKKFLGKATKKIEKLRKGIACDMLCAECVSEPIVACENKTCVIKKWGTYKFCNEPTIHTVVK